MAMLALADIGVASFPAGVAVEYEEFTFSGSTSVGLPLPGSQTAVHLVMPKEAQPTPSRMPALGRRIFGSEMFDDYGTLLVYKPIADGNEQLLQRIGELPSLDSIHYYQNTISPSLLNRIKSEHPEIALKALSVEAPIDANGNPVLVKQ